MNLRVSFFSVALTVVGLMLAGCINAQTNIGIYGNEQWSGVTALQLSAEFTQMMEEADSGGNDMELDSQEVDDWLAQAQKAAGREDLTVDFQESKGEDGSQSYVLSASGQGLNTLNEVFFEGKADISTATVNGQKQITIKHTFSDSAEQPEELTAEELAMQQQMMQAMGIGVSFRISGDQIISGNATRVEGNTAIWENPTQIEVTLTEAAAFAPAMVAVSAPPADAGFSPGAMEALMEGIAAEMAVQSTSESEGEPATESSTTTTSETTTKTGSETTPPQADNTTEQPTANSTGPATQAPNAAPATESAAAPTEADANLPNSGDVLPVSSNAAQLAMAGLMLLTLGGSAAAGLVKRS